jgi:formate hydrogenlyase subunit 3/multisubunit Na+/H+ antiporter MnhD subunit
MTKEIQLLIPAFVALPLAVSLLIQLVAPKRPQLAEWMNSATMLVLAVMSCYTIGRSGIYHVGAWPTPIGIDLRLDALATLLLLAINIVGLAVAIYSVDICGAIVPAAIFTACFC